MGFHDSAIFPTAISVGSRGGPGSSVNIITLDSLQEVRIARTTEIIRRWNAVYGIRTPSDMHDLIDFYVARLGPAYGFKFRDWLDCSTTADGCHPDLDGAAVAFGDEEIGTADGSTTVFQAKRRYTHGGITRTYDITKPDASTVKVGVNGVEQTSGWSISESTGEITFTAPPASGAVTWGGIFYWPARFGKELEEVMPIAFDDVQQLTIGDIPIIQILAGTEGTQEVFLGGSMTHDPFMESRTIGLGDGRLHVFDNVAAGRSLYLPSYAALPGGGPYFAFVNEDSSNPVGIREHVDNGGALIYSIPAGGECEVYLSHNHSTGVKAWYLI